MIFRAEINVMPHRALLDPQGKAVSNSMKNIGLSEIRDIRIGKHITLKVEAWDKTKAEKKVEKACKKLLANPITEGFKFEIFENQS